MAMRITTGDCRSWPGIPTLRFGFIPFMTSSAALTQPGPPGDQRGLFGLLLALLHARDLHPIPLPGIPPAERRIENQSAWRDCAFRWTRAVILHHLPGHCSGRFGLSNRVGSPDRGGYPAGGHHSPSIPGGLLPTHPAPPASRIPSYLGLLWSASLYPSLKRLASLGREFPRMLVLPAHRLFYNDRWGMIELGERSEEIIEHHHPALCLDPGGPEGWSSDGGGNRPCLLRAQTVEGVRDQNGGK